jgi:hypothetical protein
VHGIDLLIRAEHDAGIRVSETVAAEAGGRA